MQIKSRFIDGQFSLPLPPSDGNCYMVKDGEYVALAYTAPPASWAPSITDGQALTLTEGVAMTPYTVQGENAVVNQ